MKSYRDLEIYKASFDLGIRVHKASLRLPQYELYEEGSQLRRSSKGITSCIVEGYGRGRYKAELIKFLVYAHASCDETILHLNYVKATHEVDQKEYQYFIDSFDELGAKINRFIDYVEHSWNKKTVDEPATHNTKRASQVTR
jgi:four helix bundle protein